MRTMMLAAFGLATAVAAPVTAQDVDPEDFVVENAGTLVELCTDKPGNEYYVQAIHMCHGFVSGVGQYALLLGRASGGEIFCLPDPAPTRNEAIADWVSWMGSHPEYLDDPAPEALVRFAEEAFPCR